MGEWVENNKKKERIPRQILFMEAKLCHFTSFGPKTPSNAVQGPVTDSFLLILEILLWRRVAVIKHWWGPARISSLVQKQMLGCSQ